MTQQTLNKEFYRMQKIAGLLSKEYFLSNDESDLYSIAGEMISQVGLFTQANAEKSKGNKYANLNRFYNTNNPEQESQLIAISEKYPEYTQKVKKYIDELVNDPMFKVAQGDSGGDVFKSLQLAYERNKEFM
jgi:hypothetical protein